MISVVWCSLPPPRKVRKRGTVLIHDRRQTNGKTQANTPYSAGHRRTSLGKRNDQDRVQFYSVRDTEMHGLMVVVHTQSKMFTSDYDVKMLVNHKISDVTGGYIHSTALGDHLRRCTEQVTTYLQGRIQGNDKMLPIRKDADEHAKIPATYRS